MWIIIIIILLIFVNGFFAGAEMALVSVPKNKIKRDSNNDIKSATLIKKMRQDSVSYLSTIQVAITLAGFLSSALAGNTFSFEVASRLQANGIPISENVALVLITVILSYITLVLGELVPKRIALMSPKKIAYLTAPIVYFIMRIFQPFVTVLSWSTNGILRLLRIQTQTKAERITEQEIKEYLVRGQTEGLYTMNELQMLKRIFKYDDLEAIDIMTPKKQVITVSFDEDNQVIIKKLVNSQYSRVPIIGKDTNDIKGILLMKDLLKIIQDDEIDNISITSILRPAYIIDPKTLVKDVFQEMKASNNHMALIIEDNKLLGIITLEDIVEEIVGSIYDEHDQLPKEDA